MSFLDKLSLLFRPRERAFRNDLDKIYDDLPEIQKRKPNFDCPSCGADFVKLPFICNWCGYVFGTPGASRTDNPPHVGEKENK
jgi:hypothetical protein